MSDMMAGPPRFILTEAQAASVQRLRQLSTCTLCDQLYSRPVASLPCAHHFCRACIDDHLSSAAGASCPVCHIPTFTKELVENVLLGNVAERVGTLLKLVQDNGRDSAGTDALSGGAPAHPHEAVGTKRARGAQAPASPSNAMDDMDGGEEAGVAHAGAQSSPPPSSGKRHRAMTVPTSPPSSASGSPPPPAEQPRPPITPVVPMVTVRHGARVDGVIRGGSGVLPNHAGSGQGPACMEAVDTLTASIDTRRRGPRVLAPVAPVPSPPPGTASGAEWSFASSATASAVSATGVTGATRATPVGHSDLVAVLPQPAPPAWSGGVAAGVATLHHVPPHGMPSRSRHGVASLMQLAAPVDSDEIQDFEDEDHGVVGGGGQGPRALVIGGAGLGGGAPHTMPMGWRAGAGGRDRDGGRPPPLPWGPPLHAQPPMLVATTARTVPGGGDGVVHDVQGGGSLAPIFPSLSEVSQIPSSISTASPHGPGHTLLSPSPPPPPPPPDTGLAAVAAHHGAGQARLEAEGGGVDGHGAMPVAASPPTTPAQPISDAVGGASIPPTLLISQPTPAADSATGADTLIGTLPATEGSPPRLAPRPIVLMATGLVLEADRVALAQVATLLHGRVVTSFTPDVTHVVTLVTDLTPGSSLPPPAMGFTSPRQDGVGPRRLHTAKRTLKYMQGVLMGAWVVSSQWLHACLAAGHAVPEGEYEVDGDVKAMGGPWMGRNRRAVQAAPLFSGLRVCVHPPLDRLDEGEMEVLVQLGGATLVTLAHALRDATSLVITSLGKVTPQTATELAKVAGTVVDQAWVLDSISFAACKPMQWYGLVHVSAGGKIGVGPPPTAVGGGARREHDSVGVLH